MEKIYELLLDAALEILPLLITVATVYLTSLVRSKIKSDVARNIAFRAIEATENAVLAIEGTLAKRVKEEAEDGLTKEEADMLKSEAVEMVKRQLGKVGLKELKEIAGDNLNDWIADLVEARLEKMKGQLK